MYITLDDEYRLEYLNRLYQRKIYAAYGGIAFALAAFIISMVIR